MFLAGDAALSRGAAMCYPRGFVLPALLAGHRRRAAAYGAAMGAAVAAEGWPPPARTACGMRVRGKHMCRVCGERFSHVFASRGICVRCEAAERAAGRCPFRAACAAASRATFCRCAAAVGHGDGNSGGGDGDGDGDGDGGGDGDGDGNGCSVAGGGAGGGGAGGRCMRCEEWSCEACGLVQGDGELVGALVARLSPGVLFLDFDRTLCSTRHGERPVAGAHALDGALVAAAAEHPRVVVVTRNNHRAEIEAMLAAGGLGHAAVRCVGRRHGNDKVAVVGDRALWGGEDQGGALAVFVDDDIAELSSDALVDLSSEGRLLRVLFRR